jgi:putative flavoprotein involved in K+ transport
MSALGRDQIPVEERGPLRLMPVISGAYGGHTIDFRCFAIDGMTLLGRVTAAPDGVVEIAADLANSLAQGDAAYTFFIDLADAHIAQHGLDFPQEPEARAVLPDWPCIANPLRFLDLRAEGIGAVVQHGLRSDFS